MFTSIVPSGEIVGSIFLSRNELFGVEKLAIIPCSDFINNRRFKINKYSSGNMLSWARLAEEGVEGIVSHTVRGVAASSQANLLIKYTSLEILNGHKT